MPADTRKVGIQIEVESNAPAALSATEQAAKTAQESLSAFGVKGTQSLEDVEEQAELTGVAAGIVANVFTDLAGIALTAGASALILARDQGKATEAFRNSNGIIEEMTATVGLALVPVYNALRKTVKDTAGETENLKDEAKELRRVKLADWAIEVAVAMSVGMKNAALVALNALDSLNRGAQNSLKSTGNAVMGMLDEILTSVNEVAQFAEEIPGNPFEGLLKGLPAVRDQLGNSKTAIGKITAEMGRLSKESSKTIASVANMAAGVGNELEANLKKAKDALDATFGDDGKAQLQSYEDTFDQMAGGISARIGLVAKRLAAAADEEEKQIKRIQAQAERTNAIIASVASTQITAMLTEGKTLLEVMDDITKQVIAMAVQAAIKSLVASAAEAAGKAFAAHAWVPWVGLAIGAAAAGAAVAGVMSYKGMIGGDSATGGGGGGSVPRPPSSIGGGRGGPAVLTRQGAITPVSPQTNTQSAPIVVNANISTFELPNDTQRKRVVQELAGEMEMMARDGQIFRDFAPQGA